MPACAGSRERQVAVTAAAASASKVDSTRAAAVVSLAVAGDHAAFAAAMSAGACRAGWPSDAAELAASPLRAPSAASSLEPDPSADALDACSCGYAASFTRQERF